MHDKQIFALNVLNVSFYILRKTYSAHLSFAMDDKDVENLQTTCGMSSDVFHNNLSTLSVNSIS